MPDQIQSTPTLLSLTAAKPSRPSAASNDDDFGAELASAVESADTKPTKRPDKEAASAAEGKAPTETPPTDKQASQAEADDAVTEATEVDAEEAELLATFAVTETIVLETAPDAVLPDSAITQIDVDAGTLNGVAASAAGSEKASAIVDATNGAAAAIEGEFDSLTGQSTPAQPTLAQGDTDAGQLAASIESDAAAAMTDQPGDGSAALAKEESAAAVDPSAIGGDAESVKVSDKKSSKVHDTASQEGASTNATPTTDATLAVAPLPHENGGDSAEGGSHESADHIDANPIEGSASRDAGRAEAADKAAPVERPTIDPARFVSRVTRAIEFANQQGGGPVEMRLSPPELGALQVKIQVKDGVMTAQLEVETPAARNALLDNLPALRDRLEQQQIRIDKFEVDVRDQQQQRGGDWRQHQDNRQQMEQQQHQRHEPRPPRQQPATAAPVDSRPIRTIAFANNGINLVV